MSTLENLVNNSFAEMHYPKAADELDELLEALKKCYLVIRRLNEWDSAIEDAYQSARVALNLDTPPKIDEDRKQDDVEHSWEKYRAAREARKEMLSDAPDENVLWEEEAAEDRQREKDRQEEITFARNGY